MSKFFLLIAVALSVSFECSINAQADKSQAIKPMVFSRKPIVNLPKLTEAELASSSFNSHKSKLVAFVNSNIDLVIEDYTKVFKNFPIKEIRNQIELRLLQANIKVVKDIKSNYLHISMMPDSAGTLYSYRIAANLPKAYFIKDDILYHAYGIEIWEGSGTVGSNNLRSTIDDTMDKFLLDLLKSKQAHEKNKKELAAKNKSAPKPSSATPSKK